MHSSGVYKDPAFSVSVGIAALILEGRPNYNICNDVLFNYEENYELGRARSSENTTTQRISQKLQQIRNCPSTSKDYVENTVEISVGSPASSHSDEFAERIYVNRKFRHGSPGGKSSQYRATAKSASSRSLFNKIDASWTETSVVYNGLEQIKMLHNISPLKLTPITKSQSHTKKKHNSGLNVNAQGPHCEQFLRKIGLVKSDGCDDIDHECEYFNNIVSKSLFFCV